MKMPLSELWELSYYEYMQIRKAFFEDRRAMFQQEYMHIQVLAYYAILPHLSKSERSKSISKIIPNPYEESAPEETAEQLRERVDALREAARRRLELLKKTKGLHVA